MQPLSCTPMCRFAPSYVLRLTRTLVEQKWSETAALGGLSSGALPLSLHKRL